MNSKAFRRNTGSKSSTFISLHFNKSDEEQLEISYKNDGINKSASQSNFYRAEESPLKISVSQESSTSAKSVNISPCGNKELSPAAEDSFTHYTNDELEKVNGEISDKRSSLSERKPDKHKRTEACRSKDRYWALQSLMKWGCNSVRFHVLAVVLACVCAPVPSWLSGFLVGTILSCSVMYCLYKPQKKKKSLYNFVSPAHTAHFQMESSILKGWMNELPSPLSYSSDDYHVSCTRSVYVRVEGSYLRLSFPAQNIPKRAMFSEPRYEMQFIHQHHYDVTGATVQLLPQGLSNKRLWSKKYPICLKIANGSLSRGNNSMETKTSRKEKFVPRTNEKGEVVIYLFSRTDRDKSLWYSRFLRASRMNKRSEFAKVQDMQEEMEENFVSISFSKEQKFEMYMSALLHPFEEKDKKETSWLNVLIGRVFFDFLIEDVWARQVSVKIQNKLNRIKLPFFLTELSVKAISLGSSLPRIHSASDPFVDERGLWTDVDVSYDGSFHMTLETKLNLERFKAEDSELTRLSECNSDEDSLESSSDEDVPETSEALKQSSSHKFLRLMDKLAQSSYVQHATKNRYVKRAMEDLSNTPLVLSVEVQRTEGRLALNIPPWPTDRLWYGFRSHPSLTITARPKLGQHVVTFTQITEWIEKKLTSEFQKVLVMPNMDDLIVPIMQGGVERERRND